MDKTLEIRQFNGQNVDFEINDKSVMPNATNMAKCFPYKTTKDFLKLNSTKEFIRILEQKYGNKINVQEENSPLESDQEEEFNLEVSENILRVVHGGRNNGTWMHELLAFKFAAWLSSEFELWIYETVRSLMVGTYVQLINSYEATLSIDNEIKQLTTKLRNNEDYLLLLKLKNKKNNFRKTIRQFNSKLKPLQL
jgi:hypothetical protein